MGGEPGLSDVPIQLIMPGAQLPGMFFCAGSAIVSCMLIILGGFLGSGRKILSRKIAERHGLYFYTIADKKLHSFSVAKDGAIHERIQRAKTDDMRMRIYGRAIAEFPRLRKMYPDVILEDVFHRARPREYFIAEAQKYFDNVIFVWIESDEASVADRLALMKKKGLIDSIETSLHRRRRSMENFEELKPGTLSFYHTKSDDRAAERLWDLIMKHAGDSE